MSKIVVSIPGDGIGPEVVAVAERVLLQVAPSLRLERAEAGFGCYQRQGTSLPASTLEMARSSGAVLFGAVTTPPAIPGYQSAVLGLRRGLDLFANVRPARSVPVTGSRMGVDLVIVRENTEGLYCGIERREAGRAVSERVISERGSARIVRHALELATRQRRKRVTLVHKANILRETCGLFRRVGREVAAGFPAIELEEMLVDTCAYELVRRPERFEVIVTTNLFGDILSDVAAAVTGGLGLATSANLGEGAALFEPVHGSAPDIAGRGTANPLAAVGAAAMLLGHLGLEAERMRVEAAISAVLLNGPRTPDLGGEAGTGEVERALLDLLR